MLLLDGKLWLRLLIALEVASFTAIPGFSLALRLDLNLQKFDEEHGEGVVLEMLEKSIKDLSVLLHEKVSQKILLLLDQELIHNFEEVSTKNGQRILVTVEEARELIKQSVILSLHGRNGLFLLILGNR